MNDRMFFGQVPFDVVREAYKRKQTKMLERIWRTEQGRLVSRWIEATPILPNKTLILIAGAEPMERDVDRRTVVIPESPQLHYALFCIAALFEWALPR